MLAVVGGELAAAQREESRSVPCRSGYQDLELLGANTLFGFMSVIRRGDARDWLDAGGWLGRGECGL